MFNFFKKQQPQEEENKEIQEDKVLASISYLIGIDGEVIVDVSVMDYEETSMNGLFKILNTLSQDKCYVETVNIIKDSLAKDNQEEFLLKLVQHITKQTLEKSNKFVSSYQEIINNQPCIKPSEMLR